MLLYALHTNILARLLSCTGAHASLPLLMLAIASIIESDLKFIYIYIKIVELIVSAMHGMARRLTQTYYRMIYTQVIPRE